MKKILFCDNSLRELINFRIDIIEFYAKQGCEVLLVAPQNINYSFKYSNIKCINVDLSRSSKNPTKDLKYLFKLLLIYKREKPQYIFHYTIKPNIYGCIAAKLCNIPCTDVVAGLGYVFNKKSISNTIARFLFKFALQFAEHIIVLNSYNRDLLIEKKISKKEQIILLPGGEGVNLDKYK